MQKTENLVSISSNMLLKGFSNRITRKLITGWILRHFRKTAKLLRRRGNHKPYITAQKLQLADKKIQLRLQPRVSQTANDLYEAKCN